jgi:3-dehydroquinate synthetase/shikimate kinase
LHGIVLSGPPGVGKSTIAPAAAARLGLDALDLDDVIRERERESSADIIRTRGEAAFRDVERAAIASIDRPAVIALGGGTLTHGPSRRAARRKGPVLALSADEAVLEARLSKGGDRPLLAGGLSSLLSSREKTYRAVDRRVDASGSVDVVANAVVEAARDLILVTATIGDTDSRILVGRDLAEACAGAIASLDPKRPVLLVLDEGVPAEVRARYVGAIRSVASSVEISLEGGESVKSWNRLGTLLEQALAEGCGRQSVVVGIGGGAVCDLTGMAASLLGRGAPVVLVPSTLLAQVDASVGGKTAVNLGGRNLIGTFHPASDVLIDVALCESQREADYRSGLAELVKMAVIADAPLFDAIVAEGRATVSYVGRSVAHKARIVETDPRETGLRKILNLGHTLAHALETASQFGMRHGEAVAIGLAAVARFSALRGWLASTERDRILEGLARLNLPTYAPHDLLVEAGRHIKADKKGTTDEIDLIAIRAVGNVTIERLPWSEVQAELVRCGGET